MEEFLGTIYGMGKKPGSLDAYLNILFGIIPNFDALGVDPNEVFLIQRLIHTPLTTLSLLETCTYYLLYLRKTFQLIFFAF